MPRPTARQVSATDRKRIVHALIERPEGERPTRKAMAATLGLTPRQVRTVVERERRERGRPEPARRNPQRMPSGARSRKRLLWDLRDHVEAGRFEMAWDTFQVLERQLAWEQRRSHGTAMESQRLIEPLPVLVKIVRLLDADEKG